MTSAPSLSTSGCGGGESSRSHDFKMVVSDFHDDRVSSQAYIQTTKSNHLSEQKFKTKISKPYHITAWRVDHVLENCTNGFLLCSPA